MQQQPPRKIRWKPARLTQARAVPSNPWRGLYSIYPFMIVKDGPPEALPPLKPGHTLGLAEINLVQFREEALTDSALAQIDRIFAWFEDNRQEMIVRFLYDWDGNGMVNEPQELSVILGHIRRLSPVLKRHAERIFTLQGLFAGSWGEMHSSRHLGAKSMLTLAQALDEAAGGQTLLSVRCPNQWREILQSFDPPTPERRFDATLRSRIGLFNDGILASETDFGTYGEVSRAQAPHYGVKLNREDELAFQNRLCAGVPNGGELVRGEGGFSLADTYRAFRMMRLSYLNEDYDPEAYAWLRARENIARSGVWRGATAYAYLIAHLGYRYSVRKVTVQSAQGGVHVRIQLENTGMACCYFPLEAALYLKTPAGEAALSVPLAGDSRLWQPNDTPWLSAQLDLNALPQGSYRLELALRDPRSGKPVYLATAARGEAVRQSLPLGALELRR